MTGSNLSPATKAFICEITISLYCVQLNLTPHKAKFTMAQILLTSVVHMFVLLMLVAVFNIHPGVL